MRVPYGFQAGGGAFEVRVRWCKSDAHALKLWRRWQRWMMPKAIEKLRVGNLAFAMVRDSRAWMVVRWYVDGAGVVRDWDPVARWQGEDMPLPRYERNRVRNLIATMEAKAP